MQTIISAVHADTRVSLLIIDDDPDSLARLSADLADSKLEILTAVNSEAGLDIARRRSPRIVLITPQPGRPAALEGIVEMDFEVHLIRLTAHYSGDVEEVVADAGCDLVELRGRIARIAREVRRKRARPAPDEQSPHVDFAGIVGRSPLMWEMFRRIRQIAPHYQTVLITGEPGTGKDLAARALHRLSPVASCPFVVLDCAESSENISETLLEDNLFGQKGGTLFLKELANIPIAVQQKLLRMLKHREATRPGQRKALKTDVRVIAATKSNPRGLIERGLLLEELCRWISVVEIGMPRLADRKEDLALLELRFLTRFAGQYGKAIFGLTPGARIRLSRHSWPGNVRELEEVIGHSAKVCGGDWIDIRDLPLYLQADPVYGIRKTGQRQKKRGSG